MCDWRIRFTAEVRRVRAGHIRLRRLRGTVAARLEPHGDARHILRRGTLQLESDIAVTAQDMLRAGEAALWSGDTALAQRFAHAAAAAGGGWRASLARAEAYTMAGELDEAETLLAMDDPPHDARVPWPSASRGISICRVGPATRMRSWSRLRRTTRVSDGDARLPGRVWGDVAAAATAADAALRCTGIDDLSAMLAATAKMIAAGEVGRVDDLASTAEFARTLGVTSPSTGLLRFAFAEAHSSALQLLGLTDAADPVGGVHEDDLPPDALSVGRHDGRFGQPVSRTRRPRRQAAARRVVGAPLCVPRGLAVPLLRRPCDRVGRAGSGRRGDAVPHQVGIGSPTRDEMAGTDGNASHSVGFGGRRRSETCHR